MPGTSRSPPKIGPASAANGCASCADTMSCGATSSTSSSAAGRPSRSPVGSGWTYRRAVTASVPRRSIASSMVLKVVPPGFTAICPRPAAGAGHATAASRAARSSPQPAPSPQRPLEVEDRQTFGHWEADLLIFRREHGKANLTSMIERQTRFTILLPNPDRQSNALIGRIGQAWQGLPEGQLPDRHLRPRHRVRGLCPACTTRSGTEAFFCDPAQPLAERCRGEYQRSDPPVPPRRAQPGRACR